MSSILLWLPMVLAGVFLITCLAALTNLIVGKEVIQFPNWLDDVPISCNLSDEDLIMVALAVAACCL
jgi:hypothetical protein